MHWLILLYLLFFLKPSANKFSRFSNTLGKETEFHLYTEQGANRPSGKEAGVDIRPEASYYRNFPLVKAGKHGTLSHLKIAFDHVLSFTHSYCKIHGIHSLSPVVMIKYC